jgi:hypothetical protein
VLWIYTQYCNLKNEEKPKSLLKAKGNFFMVITLWIVTQVTVAYREDYSLHMELKAAGPGI